MDLIAILDRLVTPVAPPGREDEARQAVLDLAGDRAHRVVVDPLGSLQLWLNPEARPRVMLDAHLDEVGFIVQRVEDNGSLRVAALGGLDQRLLPGSRVILQPRPGIHLPGLVGLTPPHVEKPGEADKALPWERIYIDTGLMDAASVHAAGIEIGAPGVLDAGHGRLGERGYYARNLDDRAGCAILVELFLRLAQSPPPFALCCNFSVAEEVGLRGAAAAAFGVAPDLALCVEATVGDTPGVEPARHPAILGRGPAITVADGRIVVPWRLVESLEQAGRRAGVAWQRKLPPYGGTDAGAIHTSRAGVPTAVVSLPTRYIHSPVSLLHLDDLAATAALVAAWLELAPGLVGDAA
ncbi:MAG: M20/M25/M40 family metallo-hydrolase [Desulfarculus sp.]|nr:M20/M25/M40 family metallo-hydrolase [Desulfarculus sp.]